MEWINIKDKLPETGKEIKYIDSDGYEGITYLCPCCKKEWRCPITGSGVFIDVIKWQYLEFVVYSDDISGIVEQTKDKIIFLGGKRYDE